MLGTIPESEQETCRAVLARAKIPPDLYQFGKTKLFFRAGVVIKLEEARLDILKSCALTIQSFGRLAIAQKWVDQCYVAAAVFQMVGAYFISRKRVEELRRRHKAAITVTRFAHLHLCQTNLVPRLKQASASRLVAGLTKSLAAMRKAQATLADMKKKYGPGARRPSVDMEKKIVDLDTEKARMAAQAGNLKGALDAANAGQAALQAELAGRDSSIVDLENEKENLHKKLMELQERLSQIDPNFRNSQSPTASGANGLSPKSRRPRIGRPLSEESKKDLTELVASPLLQTELEEVVRASLPPQVGAEPVSEEEVLMPGRILQRWLLVSLTVDVPGRDTDACLAQTDAILRLVKKILTASRPVDSGMCAYWLANLTEVVSGLHYYVTNATPEDSSASHNQALAASFGTVAWAVPVISARERIVRFVEEVLGMWLHDLCGKMGGALRTAVLEHQGVSDIRAPSPNPADAPAALGGAFSSPASNPASLFKSVLYGSTPTEEKPTLDSILQRIQFAVAAMLQSGLSPSLTTQIFECLMQHVANGCFNQVMLKKSLATWKRGIQIQYNLMRLEEFMATLNIPTTTAFSFFDPVMQVSKLLQISKSAEDDPEALKETCPNLSLLQMRRVLSTYMPDRYDDGPVNPTLLQAIDAQIEEQQGEIPEGDQGVLMESGGVHFDIAAPPKAPVPVSTLPTTLPPNLLKFFILTETVV